MVLYLARSILIPAETDHSSAAAWLLLAWRLGRMGCPPHQLPGFVTRAPLSPSVTDSLGTHPHVEAGGVSSLARMSMSIWTEGNEDDGFQIGEKEETEASFLNSPGRARNGSL